MVKPTASVFSITLFYTKIVVAECHRKVFGMGRPKLKGFTVKQCSSFYWIARSIQLDATTLRDDLMMVICNDLRRAKQAAQLLCDDATGFELATIVRYCPTLS